MKYLILGIVSGVLFAFIPFIQPESGIEIYPEWCGTIENIRQIEASANPSMMNGSVPPVARGSVIHVLNGSGSLRGEYDSGEKLSAVSGNGRYLVEYEKVGSAIEFMNLQGERFWKLNSLEYPYLSFDGKLVLLLNGDHSRIRIADINGNIIGVQSISGRFCTVISFSKSGKAAAAGFLDGTYYVVDAKGQVTAKGKTPDNTVVKGIALSSNGHFCAVHYGDVQGDHVRIVDVLDNDEDTLDLKNVHLTRIALYCADNGDVAVLDRDRLIFADSDGDINFFLNVPEAKMGYSKIDCERGIYTVTYSLALGGAKFLMLRGDGNVLYVKDVIEEPFLDCRIDRGAVFLQGSQSLMGYSLHFPEN